KHGKVFREIHVREHLSNKVDTAAASNLQDLLVVIGRAVVEDVMRALLAYKLPALFASSGSNDSEARSSRELNACRADAAGRAVHEQSLAGLSSRTLEKRAICGPVR